MPYLVLCLFIICVLMLVAIVAYLVSVLKFSFSDVWDIIKLIYSENMLK